MADGQLVVPLLGVCALGGHWALEGLSLPGFLLFHLEPEAPCTQPHLSPHRTPRSGPGRSSGTLRARASSPVTGPSPSTRGRSGVWSRLTCRSRHPTSPGTSAPRGWTSSSGGVPGPWPAAAGPFYTVPCFWEGPRAWEDDFEEQGEERSRGHLPCILPSRVHSTDRRTCGPHGFRPWPCGRSWQGRCLLGTAPSPQPRTPSARSLGLGRWLRRHLSCQPHRPGRLAFVAIHPSLAGT